eukprot:270528-Chlamydomonas_euryale.AAC.1
MEAFCDSVGRRKDGWMDGGREGGREGGGGCVRTWAAGDERDVPRQLQRHVPFVFVLGGKRRPLWSAWEVHNMPACPATLSHFCPLHHVYIHIVTSLATHRHTFDSSVTLPSAVMLPSTTPRFAVHHTFLGCTVAFSAAWSHFSHIVTVPVTAQHAPRCICSRQSRSGHVPVPHSAVQR